MNFRHCENKCISGVAKVKEMDDAITVMPIIVEMRNLLILFVVITRQAAIILLLFGAEDEFLMLISTKF
ncbi:MAG TPA: hypothetical protein VFS97_09555 [Nitrososphaeraceae archaeon]|nr:hypothetical protein [Nitrososphaeraceae archaeon]